MRFGLNLSLSTRRGVIAENPNILDGGDFASATGWTVGADWTISGGVLSAAGGSGFTATGRTIPSVNGTTYVIRYERPTVVSGSIRFRIGAVQTAYFNPDATGSVELTAAVDNATFQIVSANYNGSLDNITIRAK